LLVAVPLLGVIRVALLHRDGEAARWGRCHHAHQGARVLTVGRSGERARQSGGRC
jgi:hypothetical protein